MKTHWLDEVKKRMEVQSSQSSDVRFDRLVESGIIDSRGEVTGHLRRWDAYLAIAAVKRVPSTGKIAVFRCLKPVFGMPGGAMIDISRDSMLDYLKQGKKVITAIRDDRLDMWKEGLDIHLSNSGSVRGDCDDNAEDFVGSVPEFQQSTSIF